MDVEQAVADLQSKLMAAVLAGDRGTCETLFGSDCSLIRASSTHTVDVVLRDRWLDEIGSEGKQRAAKVDDRVISVHGDVAIATVLWTEDLDGGTEHRGSVTDVWKRNERGDWQLIERHGQ